MKVEYLIKILSALEEGDRKVIIRSDPFRSEILSISMEKEEPDKVFLDISLGESDGR